MPREDLLKKLVGIKTDTEWNHHKKMYGSLLDGVFEEDEDARKALLEALRLLQKGKPHLADHLMTRLLLSSCKTDADTAAISFLIGNAAEQAGKTERALHFYTDASLCEPECYAVYLKLAKIAHKEGLFGFAEENYRKAIQSLENGKYEPKTISSVYANLSYCLTMMRRFDEAEDALIQSEILCPVLPERESIAAILHAAEGEREKTERCLALLSQNEKYYIRAKKITETILSGTHPQFSEMKVEDASMDAFWLWFEENFTRYRMIMDLMDDETPPSLIQEEISERLASVFPFSKRRIEVSLYRGEKYTFFFADAYALALEKGLDCLFSRVPASLAEKLRLIRIR